MLGVVLFLTLLSLATVFYLSERRGADDATLRLAALPFRQWRRSGLLESANTVTASRIRVGVLTSRALALGWAIAGAWAVWTALHWLWMRARES
jgi:hypothetical protein